MNADNIAFFSVDGQPDDRSRPRRRQVVLRVRELEIEPEAADRAHEIVLRTAVDLYSRLGTLFAVLASRHGGALRVDDEFHIVGVGGTAEALAAMRREAEGRASGGRR